MESDGMGLLGLECILAKEVLCLILLEHAFDLSDPPLVFFVDGFHVQMFEMEAKTLPLIPP